MAGEVHAVPVSRVIEVARLGDVTAVPGTRREILGVRNLHRQILPVIDLALVLGIRAAAAPAQVLVAEADGTTGGLAVDEILGVSELPDPVTETEQEFLLGTMLREGSLIGIIDVPAVFAWIRQAPP